MPIFTSNEINHYFEEIAPSLRLYLRQWLDEDTTQDLVQECFIQLIRERRRPIEVRPWLFRVARNKAFNWIRGSKRRAQREIDVMEMRRSSLNEWFSAHQMNSRHLEIQELLEKLDPIERESVILRIWGDFGFEELAGILGVSTSKAYRIYQSALSQLRRSIDSDLQLLTGSKPSEK